MKKHDDGYVMVLVLVVILVLSIVSAALMSLGVTNMKSQRASIDRMQDKYTAQGLVEQTVARIQAALSQGLVEVKIDPSEDDSHIPGQEYPYKEKAVYAWASSVEVLQDHLNEISVSFDEENEGNFTCSLTLTAAPEDTATKIVYTLEIKGTVTESEQTPDDSGEDSDENLPEAELPTEKTFGIAVFPANYTSYQITASSEGGGG